MKQIRIQYDWKYPNKEDLSEGLLITADKENEYNAVLISREDLVKMVLDKPEDKYKKRK